MLAPESGKATLNRPRHQVRKFPHNPFPFRKTPPISSSFLMAGRSWWKKCLVCRSGAIRQVGRAQPGAADFFKIFVLLEVVETFGGGGIVFEDGAQRIERIADEDVVPALRITAAAGEGAPLVGGVFGVAVAGAVVLAGACLGTLASSNTALIALAPAFTGMLYAG